jgi:hypothetical protein
MNVALGTGDSMLVLREHKRLGDNHRAAILSNGSAHPHEMDII